MSAPPITVHEALVKTATIEIRAFSLNGKQMTLAVFRQIPDANLVGADMQLRGTPWGWVNYHPDPQDRQWLNAHRHVVWQLGDQLRHAAVPRECPVEYYIPARHAAAGVLPRLHAWASRHGDARKSLGVTFGAGSSHQMAESGGRRFAFEPLPGVSGGLTVAGSPTHEAQQLSEMLSEYVPNGDLEAVVSAARAMDDVDRCWEEIWIQVLRLDQLFIAV